MFGFGKTEKDPFKPAPEPTEREVVVSEENIITLIDGTVLTIKNGDSCHQEDGVWYFEDVRLDGRTYDQLFINDAQVKTILCNRTEN